MNETKKTLRERKFIEAYISNGGNATGVFLAINKKVSKIAHSSQRVNVLYRKKLS